MCNKYYMARQNPNKSISESLRDSIIKSGLTFKELERQTGVLRQTLMRFVRGEQSIVLDAADKLAEFFGLGVEQTLLQQKVDQMDTKKQFGVDLVFLPNHASSGEEESETDRHDRFIHFCKRGELKTWTTKKTAEPQDIYLFWFGSPIFEISGLGNPKGVVERLENEGWDWTDADYAYFCDYKLIDFPNPITIDDIKSQKTLADWWNGRPFQGRPKSIKDASVAQQLVKLIIERNKTKALMALLQPFLMKQVD